MLSRAAYLKKAFMSLIADGRLQAEALPSDLEWDRIRTILNVLYPFKAAQKLLEGEKYVTSSFVPACIRQCRKSMDQVLQTNNRGEVRSLIQAMINDFEARWGARDSPYWKGEGVGETGMKRQFMNRQHGIHRAFIIAACLDPRWKNFLMLGGFDVDEESQNSITEDIIFWMLKVSPKSSENNEDESTITEQVGAGGDDNVPDDDSVSSLEKIRRQRQIAMPNATTVGNTTRADCEKEWKKYMEIGDLNESECPLKWWHTYQNDFPILSILARQFLAIQATSAPSERVFSRASLIISNKRTQLKSDIAGQLFYVAENIDWYEEQLKKLL